MEFVCRYELDELSEVANGMLAVGSDELYGVAYSDLVVLS
jgi:hypothetical protein